MNINDQFKKITTFVFDMDGVLTDGTLFVFGNGEFIRRMHIKDGYALQLAVKKGYRVLVISGSHSDAVVTRLQGLGIKDVFMKIHDKKELLESYIKENKLSPQELLFMGDDIPDLEPMRIVGLPCAPLDAAHEIKEVSKFISSYNGGMGCVREVIERVLKLNNHWLHTDEVTSR